MKQITLVMVMDPESLHPNSNLRKEISMSLQKSLNQNRNRNFTEAIYRTTTKAMIEESGRTVEALLSKWVTQFCTQMGYKSQRNPGLLEWKPRFSEIRPVHFVPN